MRAITKAQEAREDDELRRIVCWRADLLLRDAWAAGGEAVWEIAEDLTIDYRVAIKMRDAGCPPMLAASILL